LPSIIVELAKKMKHTRLWTAFSFSFLFTVAVSPAAAPQAIGTAAVLFDGARLIIGDGSPPIESGAFVVKNGRITAIGRRGSITVAKGEQRVDLAGTTVMPAMINVHVHIGYEGYTSWGAANYTAQNALDHLQREAFYGIGVTQSVGSSPTDASIEFQRNQDAGKFPPASRFLFMRAWRRRMVDLTRS